MNTNLKELRKLVRESLKEFNTNAAGGANQPIHAFTVPNQPSGIAGPSEVPPNPEDIANAIVVAVKHLVDPTLLTDIDVTGITHSKNAGTLSYE